MTISAKQENVEQSVTHASGRRLMYVIERDGLFFKGFSHDTEKVEFTDDIMDARWFTHTRAAHPRSGERLLTLVIDIASNSLKLQS